MDTLRHLPLERYFSRAALQAAETLAADAARWRGPVAWFQPRDSDAQALQAEALETPSRARTITVYLYPHLGEIALDSHCSCKAPRCLHAAALLLRLQRLLDWPRPLTPTQRWQQTLKLHARPAPISPPTNAGHARRVFCLLQPIANQDLSELVARLVWAEDEAGLTHAEECRAEAPTEQVEPLHPAERATAKPSPNLPPASAGLAAQLPLWQERLARAPRHPNTRHPGHVLQGAEGEHLLREWLKAGICRHADTFEPIRIGPSRQPRWEWQADAQAQAHLRLRLSADESVHAVELDGLHYLDEFSGEWGEVLLPRSAWAMIAHMPPLAPDEVMLRQNWPPHALLAGVPPPPAAPRLRELYAVLTPVLLVGASRRSAREDHVFHLTAWADYDGHRLPLAQDPWRSSLIRRAGTTYVSVHRQVQQETDARQRLAAAELMRLRKLLPDVWRTLMPPPNPDSLAHRRHYRGGADTFAALDAVLQPLSAAGFRVEYDAQLPFAILPQDTPLRAELRPAESAGWTQFQLTSVHDGVRTDLLPVILKGLERHAFTLTPGPQEPAGARWLAPIGPGCFLPLSLSRLREWLNPLVMLLNKAGHGARRQVELPDSQAMGLGECLRRQEIVMEGPQAARITQILATLRAARQTPCPLPRAFRGTLRPYQVEGLQWLQALRAAALGGVLADDMGLGKTVQVIAHILVEAENGRLTRPVLIVAPTTLVFNWLDELARFAPSLRCIDYTGKHRLRERRRLPDANVIIISYALLGSELEALQELEYSMLVLDEAQWIKNPLTQGARAVRALRAPQRLALTGTPLENHLGELWSHLDAVMSGYLGDDRTFNRSFRLPIERQQDDARMQVLRQLIAPFVLRRTKAQVAPELPPKTETVLRIAMAEEQRALYESLRLSLSREVRAALENYTDSQSRIVVLSALMRLRQVCCDPRLIHPDAPRRPGSAKLEALLSLVRSLRNEDRQVLVFSQFTSMLALMSTALREARLEHALLTGETADRRTPVRRFQAGEVGILLASLKAGGLGLNLTAADAVIHYDPWWNPAVERQAADRAHRLGREQPVFIYQLLCEDTIEEKIAAMKERKSELAQAVLGEEAVPAAPLSARDIRSLFELPPGE